MAKLCEAEADNSMDKNAANDLWEKAKALRDAADAYKNAAQKYYSAPKDKTAEDHLDSMGEALKNAVCIQLLFFDMSFWSLPSGVIIQYV